MLRLVGHWDHGAKLVLLGLVRHGRLDVCNKCAAEGGLKRAHHLRRDFVAFKHRHDGAPLNRAGRAVHVEAIRVRRHAAMLEHDAILFNAQHSAETNDVFDLTEFFEFGARHDRAVKHARLHLGVKSQQLTCRFKLFEEISDRFSLSQNFYLRSKRTEGLRKKFLARLHIRTIEQPRVTRHDPTNIPRCHAVVEQPQTGINAGFAGAHHHITGRWTFNARQLVERHALHTGGNGVLRRMR